MCLDRFSIRALLASALILAAAIMVASPLSAQTLAGGSAHTVVLKSDGTVWTVGFNAYGNLGDGTSSTSRPTILQVAGLSDVVAIAAGGNHSMALTSTGSLYVWGRNDSGQVGDGSTTHRYAPVQSTLSGVVAIAAGDNHSLALLSNGSVYAWGSNSSGQLGTGNTTIRRRPSRCHRVPPQ
ncbi:MAG TPA: hypothetical protein VEA16_08665 [Vicinamibacterales bacterium]|nr:hypothetical protein [Vicinamibacterales bacterium]